MPPSVASSEELSPPAEDDPMAMVIDHPLPLIQADGDNAVKQGKIPLKRASGEHKNTHIPPLFARGDAGHVLFRGSERVDCKQD
jgi:hypothetical protein